jgi:hypothetical protein
VYSAICALVVPIFANDNPSEAVSLRTVASEPLSGRTRLRWVILSFVPSSLMLGVTTHISTDIAAVPLLWVMPLAIYLGTFVLAFSSREVLPYRRLIRVLSGLIFASLLTILPVSARCIGRGPKPC